MMLGPVLISCHELEKLNKGKNWERLPEGEHKYCHLKVRGSMLMNGAGVWMHSNVKPIDPNGFY